MSEAIETLNKLFDTLKDASNRNEAATNKLIDQQLELVTHIKTMPVEDLRTALREHALKSEQEMKECTDQLGQSGDIMSEIKKLSTKVTKMLIVVSVTLAVATGGYFLLRYAAEKNTSKPPVNWEERLKKIEADQHEDFNKRLNQLMDEIRKEMKKLHEDDSADAGDTN